MTPGHSVTFVENYSVPKIRTFLSLLLSQKSEFLARNLMDPVEKCRLLFEKCPDFWHTAVAVSVKKWLTLNLTVSIEIREICKNMYCLSDNYSLFLIRAGFSLYKHKLGKFPKFDLNNRKIIISMSLYSDCR